MTLKTIPIKKVGGIVLWVIIIIGFLVPIVATVLALESGDQIKPTILISYAIFWGVSVYLFRVYSWNSSGEEIIYWDNEKYRIVSKSKHIKFSEQEINFADCYFLIFPTREKVIKGNEIQMGRLIVRNDEQEIDLRLELPSDQLIELLPILNRKD